MILASDLSDVLGITIPLVIVFGIFIVGPLTRRRYGHAWPRVSATRLDAIVEKQTQILEELRAVRARLDEVEHVLATVE
jgi:hypothetical protein